MQLILNPSKDLIGFYFRLYRGTEQCTRIKCILLLTCQGERERERERTSQRNKKKMLKKIVINGGHNVLLCFLT